MISGEAARQLREDGIVLLRSLLSSSLLERFRQAAVSCFAAVEARTAAAERHKFNQFSNSMQVAALADTCLTGSHISQEDLSAPLASPACAALFSQALGGGWSCRLDHSWLRKKFAPGNSPDRRDGSQGWHQDGALGVRFPDAVTERDERGYWVSTASMTELVTCWIPLDACGVDAPGLEFVRGPQPGLLHFTELGDSDLRKRFVAERFWAPEMEPGDALVFRNSLLHRTYISAGMTRDRTSVEYRLFPIAKATNVE